MNDDKDPPMTGRDLLLVIGFMAAMWLVGGYGLMWLLDWWRA